MEILLWVVPLAWDVTLPERFLLEIATRCKGAAARAGGNDGRVYGDDERRIGSAMPYTRSPALPRLGWRSTCPMFPAATRAEADLGTYNDIFPLPGRLAT